MRKGKSVSTVIMGLLLVGCSQEASKIGKGNTLKGGLNQSIEAQFIDAPVKGLSFKTASSQEGKTQDAGKFSCKKGEEVEFLLGGLSLGKAACGNKIFVQDLVSNVDDHTWQKAAAIIQTFAVPSEDGKELDLSVVDLDDVELGETTYTNLSTVLTTQVSNAKAPEGVTLSVKDESAAEEHAIQSFATHSEVSSSSELQELLRDFGKDIVIYGKLIGNSTKECYAGIAGVASVNEKSEGIFSFELKSAISFEIASDVQPNGSCTDGAYSCSPIDPLRLPKEKLISSATISAIVGPEVWVQDSDDYEQFEGHPGAIVFDILRDGDDDVKIEGTYKESHTYKNEKQECYYDLSFEKPSYPLYEEDEDDDEDDKSTPVGNYTQIVPDYIFSYGPEEGVTFESCKEEVESASFNIKQVGSEYLLDVSIQGKGEYEEVIINQSDLKMSIPEGDDNWPYLAGTNLTDDISMVTGFNDDSTFWIELYGDEFDSCRLVLRK